MFSSVETTIPAGTLPEAPVRTFIKLCAGTIIKIVINSAPGVRGEVYAKIKYRESSIFPQDEDEWVPLAGYPVELNPDWSNWDGTYVISAVFCSPQAIYSHIVDVDIEVLETPTISQALVDFVEKGL